LTLSKGPPLPFDGKRVGPGGTPITGLYYNLFRSFNMPRTVKKRVVKKTKKSFSSPFKIYWENKNYFFFYLGFLLLIVGYYVMSIGKWNSVPSLIFSPIILVITYIFVFPAAILFRNKNKSEQEEKSDTGKS
jgi:uncharacterized membrane protein